MSSILKKNFKFFINLTKILCLSMLPAFNDIKLGYLRQQLFPVTDCSQTEFVNEMKIPIKYLNFTFARLEKPCKVCLILKGVNHE